MPPTKPAEISKSAGSFISNLLTRLANIFTSLIKFTKASILSIIFIILILLLLTKMDQAFTMLIELVEQSNPKLGLLITFLLINALALALSHFPIYNYYAANLNNSIGFTKWYGIYPFVSYKMKGEELDKDDECGIKKSVDLVPKKKLFSKIFKVYVFIEEPTKPYKKDDLAHYLRYSLGIIIYSVWMLFILTSFLPKFQLTDDQNFTVKWLFPLICLVPLFVYVNVREQVKKHKAAKTTDGIYRSLAITFVTLMWITIILVALCVLYPNLYSPFGFFLLMTTSYLFMFIYVYFRLARTKLNRMEELFEKRGSRFMRWNIRQLKYYYFCSQDYLLLFSVNFLFSLGIILYATYDAVFDGYLPNGTPILMAFFYAYYFVIAALGKFFFAYKKVRTQSDNKGEHSLRFKIVCVSLMLFIILAVVGMFTERKVHELSLVDTEPAKTMTQKDFYRQVSNMKSDTIFFIASHGGGLKSNAWTLKVMQDLYLNTDMKLMDQTVAMSGASGGSLGLALYTGLSRHLEKDREKDSMLLKNRIDRISRGNYTSSDLTMTFGVDTFRKLWPFNMEFPLQDRPYYAMLKYQNFVDGSSKGSLSEQPFRSLWYDTYNRNNYIPSLIMNTASTKGKRGVLWSVKPDNFSEVFHFSEDLADLYDQESEQYRTLGYYEAVSTTNRFPVFSPAAKIPGYGHYIDAGAIDNSGLLGCLDLYFHYEQTAKKDSTLKSKVPVFIEIVNSKTLYIDHIIGNIINKEIHIEENESDNIKADLDTALNLDKIPGYVSDFIDSNPNIELVRIFMPHHISIKDVESYLKGNIIDSVQKKTITDKLTVLNKELDKLTEPNRPEDKWERFNTPWESYEPKLARHLSNSSLVYMNAVLTSDSIRNKVRKIRGYLRD